MKLLVLLLILTAPLSAGDFLRSVKLRPDGTILDHRPVGHSMPGQWRTILVSNKSPITLNDMISGKCARLKDNKIDLDVDFIEKLKAARKPKVKISREKAIIRALSKMLSEEEIQAAMDELKTEAEGD